MVSTADPLSVTQADLRVRRVGEPAILSPMARLVQGRVSSPHYVHESDRVLLDDTIGRAQARLCGVADLPSLEPGGPREYIYFDPSRTRAGIVTCGGLCPGLNNVIRGLVLELADNYGVTDVVGFRDGFRGLAGPDVTPVRLSRDVVADIHNRGGTVLGTSRGDQDPSLMVADAGPAGDLGPVRDRGRRLAARGGADRRGGSAARDSSCPSSGCRRRSTTTSRTSTRASGSRPRSPGPPTRSSPRSPRPARRLTASGSSR